MIVIDRFEDDAAYLEKDGVMIRVERYLLPTNAREGDVLKQVGDGYEVDAMATRARRALIAQKRRRAFE